MILTVFALISILISVNGWQQIHQTQFSLKPKIFQKVAAGLAVSVLTVAAPGNMVQARIDAFESATKAMTETRGKQSEDRDVSSLSPAAKKRRALLLCKESSSRKASGYDSASQCTNEVLSGNYDRILNPPVITRGTDI